MVPKLSDLIKDWTAEKQFTGLKIYPTGDDGAYYIDIILNIQPSLLDAKNWRTGWVCTIYDDNPRVILYMPAISEGGPPSTGGEYYPNLTTEIKLSPADPEFFEKLEKHIRNRLQNVLKGWDD